MGVLEHLPQLTYGFIFVEASAAWPGYSEGPKDEFKILKKVEREAFLP